MIGDALYPAALAALPDAPPVLSALGDPAPRSAGRPWPSSAPGRPRWPAASLPPNSPPRWARRASSIASGLARGIDAAAHEAALDTGTIAVLACGVDQVYPPQNAALQDAIAARGLILSEVPLGAPPIARAFPRRNRIVERPLGRHRRHRGGRPFGLPDHRPAGSRTGPRGVRRAGLANGPALRRIQ